MVRAVDHFIQQFLLLLINFACIAVGNKARKVDDRIQRRPQFVRHTGEKRGLDVVRLFRLFTSSIRLFRQLTELPSLNFKLLAAAFASEQAVLEVLGRHPTNRGQDDQDGNRCSVQHNRAQYSKLETWHREDAAQEHVEQVRADVEYRPLD